MSVLWQDLKYGARMLRKRAALTILAAGTLALGIGANTAIFSAMNGILLRWLPLRHPDRLVLFDDDVSEGTTSGDPIAGVWKTHSFSSYRYFAEHVPAFEDLAAFRSGEARLKVVGEKEGGGEAGIASGHLVSGNFFSVLEAEALVGRALGAGDDLASAPPAAVISHGYWQRRFGQDAAVIGRVVNLNGVPFTIVGVMPQTFIGLRVRRPADYWLPLHFQPQIERVESYLTRDDVYWLGLVGRLRPGTDLTRAQTEVDVAFAQYLRGQAGEQPSEEWTRTLERASVRLVPGARGISGLREFFGEPLKVLMVVTTFVLLIACANIANLLLARATERRSEVAMRLALGASPWRLTRLLLTESVLLALLGGGAGLLLALWGVAGLKRLVSESSPVDVGLSLPVFAFTLGVSILAGILFGLAPSLRAGRSDLASSMKARSAGADGGRLRTGLAPALVVVQVALSLVLLVGSGLLLRSFLNLAREDLGFAREQVLIVDIDTRIAGLAPAELSGYYRRLLERVGAVPGVRSASLAGYTPMSGSTTTSNINVEGVTPPPTADMVVHVNRVAPRYAETMGIPLVEGRGFDERDRPEAAKVALVNRAFARAYLDGASPLGRRFSFGDDPEQAEYIEIVGMVGDARFRGPKDEPERMVYLPLLQLADHSGYSSEILIRTDLDSAGVVPATRRAVAEVDSRVPVAGVKTLAEQVDASMRRERLLTRLVLAFGLLALVLACVGLYGVVSQAVARRTGEVGIRMALGADRGDILGMVLREAGALVLVGIAIGVPAAAAAAAFMRSQLFGVGPADPLTLAGSAALLVAVALVAGYLPARRASRVEPMTALRAE